MRQPFLKAQHAATAAATGTYESGLPGVGGLQDQAVLLVLLEDCQYFVPRYLATVLTAQNHGGHVIKPQARFPAGGLGARLVLQGFRRTANAGDDDKRAYTM